MTLVLAAPERQSWHFIMPHASAALLAAFLLTECGPETKLVGVREEFTGDLTKRGDMSSQWLTTVGLGLDILGVCILFRFALPDAVRLGMRMARWVDAAPYEELTPQEKKEDRAQMRQERRAAVGHWLGLACLVVGFGLQIWAAWV